MEVLTEHKQLMRGATYASVAIATLLIIVKIAAFIITGSVAILSSLVDSFLDWLASGINFLAVRHSLIPADREHRYGHGKAEAIAGLIQALFIIGSAIFLIIAAGNRLVDLQPIEQGTVGIVRNDYQHCDDCRVGKISEICCKANRFYRNCCGFTSLYGRFANEFECYHCFVAGYLFRVAYR